MHTNSAVKSRLAQFLKYIEMGQAKFADKVGLSKGFANNVGDSIRTENLQKISNTFPELNTAWLLTGEGEMLKAPKNPFSQMTERKLGESISEVIMEMYTKGEIYPASIYDKAIAEKNKELSARDRRIEELQREVWRLQNQIDDLSK